VQCFKDTIYMKARMMWQPVCTVTTSSDLYQSNHRLLFSCDVSLCI